MGTWSTVVDVVNWQGRWSVIQWLETIIACTAMHTIDIDLSSNSGRIISLVRLTILTSLKSFASGVPLLRMVMAWLGVALQILKLNYLGQWTSLSQYRWAELISLAVTTVLVTFRPRGHTSQLSVRLLQPPTGRPWAMSRPLASGNQQMMKHVVRQPMTVLWLINWL